MWCSSVNFFNFHTCEHTIPRARTLRFPPRTANAAQCRHRLLPELQRSLITFDPPAFVLDPQTRAGAPPSPPSVQAGSWPFHLSPAYTAPPARSATRCNPCATEPRHFVAAPTTDFLTAASTVDTLGVGITAAAGTELALQSPSHTRLPCALPSRPVTASSRESGQFPRLLPSLDVGAISQAPSPESDPDLPSPVAALVVRYTTNQLIGLRLNPCS